MLVCKKGRKRRLGVDSSPNPPSPSIPFIALTQICNKIRSDFKPWWMNQHCVHLRNLNVYISTFAPNTRGKKNKYLKLWNMLRILLDRDPCGIDMLPLLKLKINNPACNITFVELPYNGQWIEAEFERALCGMQKLLNNPNTEGPRWIIKGDVTQVHGTFDDGDGVLSAPKIADLRIVFKELFTSHWKQDGWFLRPHCDNPVPARFGLERSDVENLL